MVLPKNPKSELPRKWERVRNVPPHVLAYYPTKGKDRYAESVFVVIITFYDVYANGVRVYKIRDGEFYVDASDTKRENSRFQQFCREIHKDFYAYLSGGTI